MYGPYSMYMFYEIQKFSALYFTWVVLRKKHIVGNKAKGPISKRVFQENKARQIF